MKKLLIMAALVLFVASGAFAQTYSFSTFQSVFQSFASGAASALPLETSVGLNWSDAYIGQFPHFRDWAHRRGCDTPLLCNLIGHYTTSVQEEPSLEPQLFADPGSSGAIIYSGPEDRRVCPAVRHRPQVRLHPSECLQFALAARRLIICSLAGTSVMPLSRIMGSFPEFQLALDTRT